MRGKSAYREYVFKISFHFFLISFFMNITEPFLGIVLVLFLRITYLRLEFLSKWLYNNTKLPKYLYPTRYPFKI